MKEGRRGAACEGMTMGARTEIKDHKDCEASKGNEVDIIEIHRGCCRGFGHGKFYSERLGVPEIS